jgi:hypothetical protein
MRSLKFVALLSLGIWVLFTMANRTVIASEHDNDRIVLLDNCDPRIAAGWNTATDLTQCQNKEGSVSRAEFTIFLASPLSAAVVGHPSWRIAPAYSTPELGDKLRVSNGGGRGHTFTEVAEFGGGFVPALRAGLLVAPECAAAATAPGAIIPPGGRVELSGLSVGNHKFQCCIHSWMHAVVNVEPEEKNEKK